MSEPGEEKTFDPRTGRLRDVIAEVLPCRSPRDYTDNLQLADRIIAAIYKAGYRIAP